MMELRERGTCSKSPGGACLFGVLGAPGISQGENHLDLDVTYLPMGGLLSLPWLGFPWRNWGRERENPVLQVGET